MRMVPVRKGWGGVILSRVMVVWFCMSMVSRLGAVAPDPTLEVRELGVTVRNAIPGLVVDDIRDGSVSDWSGVRKGDLIRSVIFERKPHGRGPQLPFSREWPVFDGDDLRDALDRCRDLCDPPWDAVALVLDREATEDVDRDTRRISFSIIYLFDPPRPVPPEAISMVAISEPSGMILLTVTVPRIYGPVTEVFMRGGRVGGFTDDEFRKGVAFPSYYKHLTFDDFIHLVGEALRASVWVGRRWSGFVSVAYRGPGRALNGFAD